MTLGSSNRHALSELVAVVLLALTVLLDHRETNTLHALIGGETPAAVLASPAALDRRAIFGEAAIRDLGIFLVAVRTLHMGYFASISCLFTCAKLLYIVHSNRRTQHLVYHPCNALSIRYPQY